MTTASSMSTSPGGEGRCREPREATGASRVQTVARLAVGVDGYPEGRDAAALGAAIARSTGAELMLVAVYSTPLVPAPRLGPAGPPQRVPANPPINSRRGGARCENAHRDRPLDRARVALLDRAPVRRHGCH